LAWEVSVNAWQAEHMAIEMIGSYGMSVGKTIFETCVWIGRFIAVNMTTYSLIERRFVKRHVCNSPHAKDKNIRQALIDRFPATGGGKIPQIGTKTLPGPLYGFSKDQWAALGVAVTWAECPEWRHVQLEADATTLNP